MTLCYQKHPFEIESEDRLTTINTKIFEIKKKIQLSEGQRKSCYEVNEAEKQRNNELIETLKKEVRLRLTELAQAKAVIGEEVQLKKYLNEVCPVGNKNADQIIHNLDLKVIEQRKMLDLLKYEKRSKKNRLTQLEKEYERLLIESTKSELVKSKISTKARKHASHLENEIHKVLIQWTEAELVKKKYFTIRQALIDDSVKFESSLSHVEDLLNKQREEISKLEQVREEAAEMRLRATAATASEAARAQEAEHSRASERAYFAQRFAERKRELEKLEKRIFPPQGVTDTEEVFNRFQGQRETSKRLSYLQRTTEEEKLQLEDAQTSLMAELEAFKFASVKDKDEGQDQINELKEEIAKEDEIAAELSGKLEDITAALLDIKQYLYDLCKVLDVIGEPTLPEWTAEARDVQELVEVLTTRFAKACARAADIRQKHGEAGPFLAPTSRPSSVAVSASHSTTKEAERQSLLTRSSCRRNQSSLSRLMKRRTFHLDAT
ncbi:hypothetical protein ACJJTC_009411 [Scirpophaga incertulas]